MQLNFTPSSFAAVSHSPHLQLNFTSPTLAAQSNIILPAAVSYHLPLHFSLTFSALQLFHTTYPCSCFIPPPTPAAQSHILLSCSSVSLYLPLQLSLTPSSPAANTHTIHFLPCSLLLHHSFQQCISHHLCLQLNLRPFFPAAVSHYPSLKLSPTPFFPAAVSHSPSL